MNLHWQKLAQEKIKARKKLLKLDPKKAQELANQTLNPDHWHFDISQHSWEESIPTHYGKIDP